ncbi:hypothetical protein [Anaerococcus prevotii]|uniref:Putative membrane protein n=1 Tax=Anaerococcus prevotii ACS-065-V-Col13 TaxID=879305 RepID=F0GTR4_9FIRM|nr:hypothetical protein [Anaerococcus prevotii]EGC82825.1 putative membrane protein [Anaerococcus prevotii ACS-065-V-Col13]
MRNFTKLFKFTAKRFSLWLALITVFMTMTIGLTSRRLIQDDYKRFNMDAIEIWEDIEGKKFDKDFILDDKTMDELDVHAMKYKEKYKIIEDDKLWQMDSDYQTDYYDRLGEGENGRNAHYTYNDFMRIFNRTSDGKLSASSYLDNLVAPVMVIIALFAITITSIEESMPIFEFTRMMPWKKRDDLLMKIGIAFIFGILIFAINAIILSFLLKSSGFGPVVSMKESFGHIGRDLLVFLATSILSTSLGFIAGNIIGHIGLFIITIGGVSLIKEDLTMLVRVFSNDGAMAIDNVFANFMEKQDIFVRTLISLTNIAIDNIMSIGAFLIISILVLLLALTVNKKSTSERSGYMVVSKPISIFAKLMGSLTLANVITSILSSMLVESAGVVSIIVFALALLLSYKFFDILFKIRLKF